MNNEDLMVVGIERRYLRAKITFPDISLDEELREKEEESTVK